MSGTEQLEQDRASGESVRTTGAEVGRGDLPDGTVIDGRFEIEGVAGRGGMSVVYRARDLTSGSRVALKLVVNGEHGPAMRFLREATALAALRHPRIVRHVAHGFAGDGRLYLAMTWLDGEDLARRLARARLEPADGVKVVLRVAEALAEVHAQGMVHRDIKPSNLFLVGGELEGVTLLDFGIVRVDDESGVVQTATGTLLGTPLYMSPEQARGDKRVDARSDVFALGAVLFACLTGRPPFQGATSAEVRARILTEDAPRLRALLPGVSSELDALTAQMLARNPEERPANASAVARALGALAAGTEGAALRVAPLSREERRIFCVLGVAWAGATGASREALQGVVAAHGVAFTPRGDGGVVFTQGGMALPEQALRVARCALSVSSSWPGVALTLATGPAVLREGTPEGEVVEYATREVRDAPDRSRVIRVDRTTADLLAERFELSMDGGDATLVGEVGRTDVRPVPDLFGRERELSVIEGAFAECVAEPVARVLLLTGSPGIGKTRLTDAALRAFARRAPGVTILRARGESLSAGVPFGLIAAALRTAFDIGTDLAPESGRARIRAALAGDFDGAERERVGAFLGELMGVPFSDEDDVPLRAARADAALLGEAMRRAWEDWLAARVARGAVVLALDDLQWSDAASVQFVGAAMHYLRERPWMVLAAARPEVRQRFPALWAEHDVEEVAVGPLSRRASGRVAQQVAGAVLEEAVLAGLHEQSAGNPFVLRELVRARIERPGEAQPATTYGLLQARFDAMSADVRRVLRAASVFGERFWSGGVVALLGEGDYAHALVGRCFAELDAREVIESRPLSRVVGEAEYAFRHALLCEAAYATIPEEDRVAAHGRAALWLEQVGGAEPLVLAEHFRRGEMRGRAIAWCRRGAEHALQGGDPEAVVAWADRAIAWGAAPHDVGALRALQAEAHYWRNELPLAEERGVEAAALVPPGTAAWFGVVAGIIRAAGQQGANARVAEWTARASAAEAAPDARARQIAAISRGGAQLAAAGRLDEALALARRVAELEATVGELDPNAAVSLHRFRAKVAYYQEDMGKSLEFEALGAAASLRVGDLRGACEAWVLRSSGLAVVGRLDESEALHHEAVSAARRLGSKYVEHWALYVLGKVYALRGDGARTRAVLERVIAALATSPRIVAGARIYLSLAALLTDNPALAEEEARRAVALPVPPPVLAAANAALARALVARGELAEATAAVARGRALWSQPELFEEFTALILLASAEVEHATGAHASARATIDAARSTLGRVAAKMRDPAHRDSFLRGHPLHARVLLLADDWGRP